MKRLAFVVIIAVLFAAAPPALAAAPTVAVEELIGAATAYDGETVTIEGEIVGDIMHRQTVTWINVNDGTGTIGIWGEPELFAGLAHAGAYSHRGDIVRITGVFHVAAAQHGGDLAIEAAHVSLIASGGPVARPVDPGRLRLAMLAAAAMLALGGAWLWRWRKLRRAASGPV